MLYYDVKRILKLRGVDKPYAFLVRHGFVPQTASNMVNNRARQISPKQIEKLCVLLNCTPNDLFAWQPDKHEAMPESHPLKALYRDKPVERLDELLRRLPAGKMDRLAEMIEELNAEE